MLLRNEMWLYYMISQRALVRYFYVILVWEGTIQQINVKAHSAIRSHFYSRFIFSHLSNKTRFRIFSQKKLLYITDPSCNHFIVVLLHLAVFPELTLMGLGTSTLGVVVIFPASTKLMKITIKIILKHIARNKSKNENFLEFQIEIECLIY